jgi:aspartate/methionine/tyrosine aminotransferase
VENDVTRPLTLAAAERGVLVAPGDCFGCPSSFRLGFGGLVEGLPEALDILAKEINRFIG